MIALGLSTAPEGCWTVSTYTWAGRRGHDIGVTTSELHGMADRLVSGEVIVAQCDSQSAMVTLAHSQTALDAYYAQQDRVARRERERVGLRKCLIKFTRANPMRQSQALLLDVVWYAVGVSAPYREDATDTAHRILSGQDGALAYASQRDWFRRAQRDMQNAEVSP